MPAGFVGMIILVITAAAFVWILFLTRLDPNRRDKHSSKTIIEFFFAGLFSALPALGLYLLSENAFSFFWTENEAQSAFIYNFVFVGPIEEFSKFIIFIGFSVLTKSIKEPRDGALQAAAVALAFATVENFFYGYDYGMQTLLVRSIRNYSPGRSAINSRTHIPVHDVEIFQQNA